MVGSSSLLSALFAYHTPFYSHLLLHAPRPLFHSMCALLHVRLAATAPTSACALRRQAPRPAFDVRLAHSAPTSACALRRQLGCTFLDCKVGKLYVRYHIQYILYCYYNIICTSRTTSYVVPDIRYCILCNYPERHDTSIVCLSYDIVTVY